MRPYWKRRREGSKAQSRHHGDDVAKIKGITAVIPLPFGVAVIGNSVEATQAGRDALKVTWDMAATPGKGHQFRQGKGGVCRARPGPKSAARTAYKVGEVWDVLPGREGSGGVVLE